MRLCAVPGKPRYRKSGVATEASELERQWSKSFQVARHVVKLAEPEEQRLPAVRRKLRSAKLDLDRRAFPQAAKDRLIRR